MKPFSVQYSEHSPSLQSPFLHPSCSREGLHRVPKLWICMQLASDQEAPTLLTEASHRHRPSPHFPSAMSLSTMVHAPHQHRPRAGRCTRTPSEEDLTKLLNVFCSSALRTSWTYVPSAGLTTPIGSTPRVRCVWPTASRRTLCTNTCRTGPTTEPKRRKRKEEKRAHICIYIVIFTTIH